MKYKAMGLSDFSSPRVLDPVYGTTGHHRMNGVMIWHGPGVFRQAERYTGARIYDLAPTLLYAMGLPVPREMDGRVLLDIFEPEFRQHHTLTYIEAEAKAHHEGDSAYSDEEESELRDTLRALGYVT
jgi:arylsulfatase A-like enzyme